MRILSIVGARPQFVKLGPLSRVIRKNHEEIILHTGQHYDQNMSDSFFDDLEIPKPNINLRVGSGSHAVQTAKMLEGIEKVILEIEPDWVLVFGDTNSTLAGSLVAAKLGVKCAHIEAGLRSFNKSMPEEINRIISDHTADLLFAPTQSAMDNLSNEGLALKSYLVGDIMVDAIDYVKTKVNIDISLGKYDILTIHRPYNVDDKETLVSIINLIGKLDNKVIFPVHPRTREKLELLNNVPKNLLLVEPIGYTGFQGLIMGANRVFTDSGGLQKEAYIHRKKCFTLRPETEWVETIKSGWNTLINPNNNKALNTINKNTIPSKHPNLFGDNISLKIIEFLENNS